MNARRFLSIPICVAFVVALSHPLAGQEAKDAKVDEKGAPGPELKDPKLDEKKATEKLLDKAKEEYRLFFKKPEKVYEFWAAMKFEVEVGKYDLAALHLKLLLEKEPAEETDKELLKIEEAEGLAGFLRMQSIQQWSEVPHFQAEAQKNVQVLIQRITGALEKHLSDPARIGKLIKNLDAPTVEERAYAFTQLNRSGPRAVPYLVEALQTTAGTSLYRKVYDAMLRLTPDMIPAFLEVFKAVNAKDASSLDLRLPLLDIIHQRGDGRAVPYLWHLSSAPMYPPPVQKAAKKTLGRLLETDPAYLPAPKLALTELAEKYYQHKVKFPDPAGVKFWAWDGQKLALVPEVKSPEKAEEFFGLRFAREALDLDPGYQPAQVVFLSLTLERTIGAQLEQIVNRKTPPGLDQLLATVDSDILMTVLERALDEDKIPVIIGAAQALGDRGELRAARPAVSGRPHGVVRTLYYPDRRVQLAAARAMLRMPNTPPVATTRVVEILTRFLAADPVRAKILVAFAPVDKANVIRQALKTTGYDAVLVSSAREMFEKLHSSADFELVVIHDSVPEKERAYLLTNLQKDADAGRLPTFLLSAPPRQEEMKALARQFRQTTMLPEAALTLPEDLKKTFDEAIKDSSGAKLSADERKALPRIALDILWRMARGEITGYDVRPAADALWAATLSEDLAVEAIETLGRVPGAENQQKLVFVVLDPARGKLRLPAAIELNRHIQRHSLLLTSRQIAEVRKTLSNPDEDAALRAQIAAVIGALRPSATATGRSILEFRPEPSMPPKDEKEKEKKPPK